MRITTFAIGIALFVAVGMTGVLAGQAQAPAAGATAGPPLDAGRGAARGPAPQVVWSPKAIKPGAWTPPHTKLDDVLAKHKGKADWVETIVDDDTLHAEYISMAPGAKTPRRMNGSGALL